jgi:endonuclease G, mitochondrial
VTSKARYILLFIFVISILFFIERAIDRGGLKNRLEQKEKAVDYSSEFKLDLLPTSTTGMIIEHSYYTLSYREDHEQAEWVAYELQRNQIANNEFDRPYFIEDKDVVSGSADWKNYKNSGYDRGHLCPAGDRRFSYEAYQETFLTSNISPQNREFNSGVWNFLEQKVRVWANKYDGVYVVTGGVLKEGLPTIGYQRISVPDYFYKIIFDTTEDGYKMIAFLIPNESISDSYYNYVVHVDYIEELTGIDFFPQLPDSIESYLESKIDLKSWGKN